MKYYKKVLFIIPLAGILILSCSKWTEIERNEIDNFGGYNTMNNAKSQKYYKELREWKATAKNYGRPVSFGWFSNWAPAGAVRKGYLASLPDSIDMISLWGTSPFNLSKAKVADKEYMQKTKGTKIFVCYILHNIGTGITPSSIAEKIKKENPTLPEIEINKKIKKAEEEYWGFTSGIKGSKDHIAAIQKYAHVLCDSIVKYDYDGLDIDWEPNIGGDGDGTLKAADGGGKYLHVLVKELGKYLGPKANIDTGKRRYLLVDGEITNVATESGEYFDYFISQAYGSGEESLNYRAQSTKKHFGDSYHSMKHIFTENFESYSQRGGQLLTQAAWNPSFGAKGGVGAYRLDNDYDNAPDYKYMRQAIQLLHKSYKEYMKKKNKKQLKSQ